MIHFLDIGANEGQTFDLYLRHHPELNGAKVWCFEPSPRHFSALIKKAEAYSDQYQITLCPFGLGNTCGPQVFYEHVDPLADSFFSKLQHAGVTYKAREASYSVQAAVVKPSDFIRVNTTAKDKVIIKIDAEGSEYAILEEMLEHPSCLRKIQRIMVEWHRVKNRYAVNLLEAYTWSKVPLEDWPY